MCGIVGYINLKNICQAEDHQKIITSMGKAITHRGPDDFGHWISKNKKFLLALNHHSTTPLLQYSNRGEAPKLATAGVHIHQGGLKL